MKVKLFTHTDLDGVGCSIVAKHAFKEIDVEYCNYDDVNERVLAFLENEKPTDFDNIFVTDISVNENVAERLDLIHRGSVSKVKLLDHHATAKWLNKYEWAEVDDYELSIYSNEDKMKSSGTSMLYDYLWNHYDLNDALLVEFVEKVRRYDTWEWSTKFNDLHAKQLNDLLYLIGRDKFIERFSNYPSIKFTDGEKLILEVEQNKIDNYIRKQAERIKVADINGYKAGVVFAEQYSSQLGNELAKQFTELDFIVMIDLAGKKVSYRGIKEEIDLGKDIAKLYGGGGHPRAAGSQIENSVLDKLIKNVFSL